MELGTYRQNTLLFSTSAFSVQCHHMCLLQTQIAVHGGSESDFLLASFWHFQFVAPASEFEHLISPVY